MADIHGVGKNVTLEASEDLVGGDGGVRRGLLQHGAQHGGIGLRSDRLAAGIGHVIDDQIDHAIAQCAHFGRSQFEF